MKLQVNQASRYAKMRAHTATHLLHSELGTIFPQTKQAGSLVDEDYVRFDFYADRLLSDTEIHTIEYNINSAIAGAFPVSVTQTSFQEATQMGAKAFFEDKYGDVVRVVSVDRIDADGNIAKKYHSLELCGGTHVANTKDIGSFVIVGQQAVASGIKRVTAYTGPKVIEYIQEKNAFLSSLAAKMDCNAAQLSEKVSKLISDNAGITSQLESVRKEICKQLSFIPQEQGGISYESCRLGEGLTAFLGLKDIANLYKQQNPSGNFFFTDSSGGFLIYSSEGNAKKIMSSMNLTGGGNEVLCQGKTN